MVDAFAKSMMSAWLWSIGWGWYQVPINTLMLTLLLVFVARLSIIRSVFCSLFFTVGAFVMLTVVALIFGLWLNDFSYTPESWGPVLDGLQETLYLGFVYTVAQLLLAFFVRKMINSRVPILLLLSNMITAVIVYQMLPKNVM